MENDILNSWWNYKTCEWEHTETPTDFTDYIPQSGYAQGAYRCCIELGMTPARAAIRVLSVCVGIKPDEDNMTLAVASQP